MRTVHITVVIVRLIVFAVDTDTFYLISVIILAGNTVDTDAIQILYPIDFRIEFTMAFAMSLSMGAPFCRAR